MAHVQKKHPGDKWKTVVIKKVDEHKQETERGKKVRTYLKTVPAAKKKFKSLPKRKKNLTGDELLIVNQKYSASKEEAFGLGPLVFPCLQRFNNIKSFLTLYVAAVLTHGAIFAFVDMILNIYQAQLSLSKMESYFMDFSDYIVSFVVAIFIAHFGSKGNRTKWVAASCILMGLASIFFAFPFSKYEIIKPGRQKIELCVEGNGNGSIVCGESPSPSRAKCIYFHITGQCIQGIAGMPIHILGTTFIFDHIPTSSAGYYLAFGQSAHLMGYLLGLLGGMRNFMTPPKEKLATVEPAKLYLLLQSEWWKTFLFAGAISLFISLMISCYPASLPGAHKLRLRKRKDPPSFDWRLKNKEIPPHLKGFFCAIWYMLRNPLLMTQAFSKVSQSLTFHASLFFLPHHLQSQFLITPGIASVLTGLFVLPGGVLGNFLGGLIVDRLEMTDKNKLKFTLLTTVTSILLFLLIFFVECETTTFAGINEDYDGYGKIGHLTAECNENCDCTTSLYSSICGRDEKEYFSPCFAGCKTTKVYQNEKVYFNCSCIKEGLTTSDDEGNFIDAHGGTCNTQCNTLPLFFAFYFSATVFSNMCSVPVSLVILKSVPANFNSYGLGVTYVILRFSASISEPLLFTMTSAAACIYWDINKCGVVGKCWIYNKTKLVYAFMGTWVTFQLFTVLLNIYALHKYDHVVKGNPESNDINIKGVKERKERKT